MPLENPYQWSTDKLLQEFMNACIRAGRSNSGLVISSTAGNDLTDMYYLHIVVLARIDQAIPPFESGDRVKAKMALVTPSNSNDWKRSHCPREISQVVIVRRVFYCSSNRWELIFRGMDESIADISYDEDGGRSSVPLRFKAENFEFYPLLRDSHRKILKYFRDSYQLKIIPSDLASKLNPEQLPIEILQILEFLTTAGYLKKTAAWFPIKRAEDEFVYELI